MRNKAHVIHQRQEEDAEDIEALLCVPLIWPHEDVLTPDLKLDIHLGTLRVRS
jgi:hypothetical protein